MRENIMELLEGFTVGFHGVCTTCFKISNPGGTLVLEAVEDSSDGYRSYLESIQIKDESNLTFFDRPIAEVQIRPSGRIDGWSLVDSDGHVWLEFGTDHSDSYYPLFVFEYCPKPGTSVCPPGNQLPAELRTFMEGFLEPGK